MAREFTGQFGERRLERAYAHLLSSLEVYGRLSQKFTLPLTGPLSPLCRPGVEEGVAIAENTQGKIKSE